MPGSWAPEFFISVNPYTLWRYDGCYSAHVTDKKIGAQNSKEISSTSLIQPITISPEATENLTLCKNSEATMLTWDGPHPCELMGCEGSGASGTAESCVSAARTRGRQRVVLRKP